MSCKALLIAGPTASGKSAVALRLAERFGGRIVNADSMQVYTDLRVLTARPPLEETTRAPHWLFGDVDGAENDSVGRWLARAHAILNTAWVGPTIFVGGTGLNFSALTRGLSMIPAVPDDVRARVRGAAEGKATAELHAELAEVDPLAAQRLRPSDRQRLLRALEVWEAAGRSIVDFHGIREAPPLAPGVWRGLFLAPERAVLVDAITKRFDLMLAAGALDEVAALVARRLDPALPVMHAHGVPHLAAHLRGELSREAAAELAIRDTRRYSKRQVTWARGAMTEFAWAKPAEAEAAGATALQELGFA